MSPFTTKNLYYLRISANSVLPLYVFLDEQHTSWMTDRVFQYVLADLRPLIIPKLRAEADAHIGHRGPANAKRGTIDVHRGDTYQFAFFFKKTEPHSILIKTRNYVARPPPPIPPPPSDISPPDEASNKLGKRSRGLTDKGRSTGKKKKPKVKGDSRRKVTAEEDGSLIVPMDVGEDDDQGQTLRRSRRSRKQTTGGYQEIEIEEESSHSPTNDPDGDFEMQDVRSEQGSDQPEDPVSAEKDEPPTFSPSLQSSALDVESQTEESKPGLQLRYNGFHIFGRCLCVVIEPWPVIRGPTPTPNATRAPSGAAADSVMPTVRPAQSRGQTPLFLPEEEREQSVMPALDPQQNQRPPVPLFNNPSPSANAEIEDDDDDGELMLFSQMLNTTGELRMEADDEDEFFAAVLFGDADETKELQ